MFAIIGNGNLGALLRRAISWHATGYFLGDALGSVRQLADENGAVMLAKDFEPYGDVLGSAGSGASSYGFTGEWVDASELIYLRARYYNPWDGRFLTKDPSRMESNLYLYTNANPINRVDPSGLASTSVNCNMINDSLEVLYQLRTLCNIANGNPDYPTDRDAVLAAREQFFRKVADLSYIANIGFGKGFWYAGKMLENFLDSVRYVDVQLNSNSSFLSDQGILRATKIKLLPSADDALEISPLLHEFLYFVKDEGVCDGIIPNRTFKGKDTYTGGFPRPYNMGWWGAFGHVEIDVKYSNNRIHKMAGGYYITTKASYIINDNYHWGDKEGTPLPLGPIYNPLSWRPRQLESIVGMVEIPHEWEVSLRNYGLASEYNFSINWTETLDILVPETFSGFYTQGLYDELKK